MQQAQWNATFSHRREMFGSQPGEAATAAAALFPRTGQKTVLELGSGQRRDTLFLAKQGFSVAALHSAQTAVDIIVAKGKAEHFDGRFTARSHDVSSRKEVFRENCSASRSRRSLNRNVGNICLRDGLLSEGGAR